jgi:hypothetical protein
LPNDVGEQEKINKKTRYVMNVKEDLGAKRDGQTQDDQSPENK